jgi:Ca2+-binding RTX toxin-like protein
MAKVQLSQPTNMDNFPYYGITNGAAQLISSSELDVVVLHTWTLTCQGTFASAPDGVTGTISRILIDMEDLGIWPNIDITGLSYQLSPTDYILLSGGDFYFFCEKVLSGDDTIIGSSGDDVIYAFDGNDIVDGGAGADRMSGGAGNDKYYVDNLGDVVLEGAGEGTDTVYTKVNFAIDAGASIQYLRANAGATGLALSGNELANRIFGGSGQDLLSGGAGVDVLDGGAGADIMSGGLDSDTYYVDNPGDSVAEAAGEGTDTVYTKINFTLSTGNSIQILKANAGSTGLTLTGNELANTIIGLTGNDRLNGGLGSDILDGGLGSDTLRGSSGTDLFAFTTALGATNVDTVADFSVVSDTIRLENAIFAGLATGVLSAGAFFKGTAAHDADDRIVYNAATGGLFFDKDGTGAAAAVQFATVSTGLAITNSNFAVV